MKNASSIPSTHTKKVDLQSNLNEAALATFITYQFSNQKQQIAEILHSK